MIERLSLHSKLKNFVEVNDVFFMLRQGNMTVSKYWNQTSRFFTGFYNERSTFLNDQN